ASVHQNNKKVLHGLKKGGESFRNDKELRNQYKSFQRRYWKWRASQFEKGEM
ncbi:HNH/ENDO VII family nuclease, partial [Bacillus subtilis]